MTVLILGIGAIGQSLSDDLPKERYSEQSEMVARIGGLVERPLVYEKGVINGIAYSVTYDHGKPIYGKFGNRSVGCGKDRIDDSVSCSISLDGITVWYNGGQKYSVHAATTTTPGSKMAIRIDADKAIYGEELISGAAALAIVNRIQSAKSITVRYTEWPRNYGTDTVSDTAGFSEAHKFMKWLFARQK